MIEEKEDTEKCKSCEVADAQDLHPCPYNEELGSGDELCNCCYSCSHECLMDI